MSVEYRHTPRYSDERETTVRRVRDAIEEGTDQIRKLSNAIVRNPGEGFDTGDYATRVASLLVEHAAPLLPPEASPGRHTLFDSLASFAADAARVHVDLVQQAASRGDALREDGALARIPNQKGLDRSAEAATTGAVYVAQTRGRGIIELADMLPGEMLEAAKTDRTFNKEIFGNSKHLEKVSTGIADKMEITISSF